MFCNNRPHGPEIPSVDATFERTGFFSEKRLSTNNDVTQRGMTLTLIYLRLGGALFSSKVDL